ncbi:MAG TPA: hypothetical protein VGZ02_05485 [Candidatus Baltobacteraceae bacterium]|jgi:hypothetical protein|nr:hypothetical protein [Candidatus Baltobacteraceae bacterium]
MSTNQSSTTDNVRNAVRAYADDIPIPAYDERAIRARLQPNDNRGRWRRPAVAIAAAAVLAFLVFDGRNVLAQVEHMFHVFVSVNGKMVNANTTAVTLEQARRDMPFTVIAPAGLPSELQGDITEVVPPNGANAGPSLIFRYDTPQGPLTISESRGLQPGSRDDTMFVSRPAGAPGALPQLPPIRNGGLQAYFRSHGGTLQTIHPIVWTAQGTTIVLASPPGVLTSQQIALIQRSMR